MNRPKWQFPRNEANENEGPHDVGVTHFMANREESIIRETIQNSLDAQSDPNRPVEVEFKIDSIPTSTFDASELADALRAAADSPHNNDKEYEEQFNRAHRLLRRNEEGSLDILKITDSNTTGADDEPRPNGAPSKWEALTKGTGSNEKDQRDAAGSYGLGKFAAFAVTDLRTVLYSVAYKSNSQLHRRFQGKAILVSHERGGRRFRRIGYLGAADFWPLKDSEVPRPFRLQAPGTALYILGYEAKSGWKQTGVNAAIKHFFHAVVHGKLKVAFDMDDVKEVAADNVLDLATSNKVDEKTSRFVKVSGLEPVGHTAINGIGKVSLRIQIYEDSPGRREIALIRDAGMMITDNAKDMNIRGLGRFPQHWKGFTAIIECLSFGKPSLLRDSESPQHNKISLDYIVDPTRKTEAKQRLAELGQWCYGRIAELAEPVLSETENAQEVAQYLHVEDEGEQGKRGNARGEHDREGVTVTSPYQSNQAPPHIRLRGSRSRARVVTPGSGTASGGSDGPVNPEPPSRSGPRRPRTVTPVPTSICPSTFSYRRPEPHAFRYRCVR